MPRLPVVGDDDGSWGTILNEYLAVAHTPEGSLKFERWANAAARPATPTTNQVGFNIETESIEQYDGADWVTLASNATSGVSGDGTGVTDKGAFRDAIGLSDVGFYDDFSRHPSGSVTTNTLTPLVGATWGVAGGTPVITDDGLHAQEDGNFYLGSTILCPDGILDATFEVEQRLPAGQYSNHSGGFTFSYKTTPNIANPGGGVSDTVHINFDVGGPVPARYQPSGSPSVTLISTIGSTGSHTVAPNRVHRYRVWAQGTKLLIFYPGAMWEYEVSDGPSMIASTVYFYYQSNRIDFGALDDPSVRGYTALRRMWANAPLYDHLKLDLSSPLEMGADAVHPALLEIRPETLPLVGHGIAQSEILNKTLKIGGATLGASSTYSGGGLYVEGKIHQTSPVQGYAACPTVLSEGSSISAAAASVANSTTAGALLVALSSMLPGLPARHTSTETLCGTFGANANTKRLVLKESGATAFDSGDITQNGGAWRLTVRRQSLTAMSATLFIEFFSTATGVILTTYAVNRGLTYSTINLHVAGVAVGDVTCSFKSMIITQPY